MELNKISFANTEIFLQGDGSIYWPKNKSLILSDLHLEKSSFFAKFGNFLPPYDSFETLAKLQKSLKKLDVKKIIFLGDIFHDPDGIKRLNKKLRFFLENLCNSYEVIWLAGNHDGELKPDLAYYCNKYTLEGINFNHKAEIKIINEFSGHYHPKATVSLFKKKISRPCFLIGESKIILPAYGAYTGGIDSKNNIFKEIFKNEYKVYLLLNNTVVKVIENVL